MSQVNPLLCHPFYSIPGISPNSPISQQVEQIDQLNTLLLQEIDANFAKFHQIITTRILPQIKRYAIAAEPVKEGAKFWRSFYEAAAEVHVQLASDQSLAEPVSPQQSPNGNHQADQSYIPDEASFMFQPDQIISSTPIPGRTSHHSQMYDAMSDEDDSLASPFDTLERRLRDDLRINDGGGGVAGGSVRTVNGRVMRNGGADDSDMPTPSLPSGYDLPGLQSESSIGSIIHQNQSNNPRMMTSSSIHHHPSIHTKNDEDNSATPKATRQPLKPTSNANISEASRGSGGGGMNKGILDIRNTPLNMKFKPKLSLADLDHDDSFDDDHLINNIMSPPVTMKFGLPPRVSAIMSSGKSGNTPQKVGGKGNRSGVFDENRNEGNANNDKSHAQKIVDDLMDEMSANYIPSPRIPTPEGLRRYSIMPSNNHQSSSSSGVDPASRLLFAPSAPTAQTHGNRPSGPTRRSMANTSYGSDIQNIEEGEEGHIYSNEDSINSNDDSLDEDDLPNHNNNNDAYHSHPSQQYSLQPGTQGYGQHIPGSISSGGSMGPPVMMQYDLSTTSSMDDDHSETGMVFGGPSMARNGSNDGNANKGGFSLMKQDEMFTFHGGRLEDAAGREVDFTPTNKGR